jgi:hypothetical protein
MLSFIFRVLNYMFLGILKYKKYLIFIEMSDTSINIEKNKYAYSVENVQKYAFIVFVIVSVGAILALILSIVLVAITSDAPATFKNFQKALSMGGTIEVNVMFSFSQRYLVPNITGNMGRAYITITGGGGGGCSGSTLVGGGGNSGASGVRVPIVIHNADICQITIGGGGNPSSDGGSTRFVCYPPSGSIPTVDFTLLGGRSGCFNNTGATRNGDDSFPFISERFGARPDAINVAEPNIYGGIGGTGDGGGAGSVFGNGGNTGLSDTKGQNAPSYGAGGGGGGASTTSGTNSGGIGGSGFVQLNFYVNVES